MSLFAQGRTPLRLDSPVWRTYVEIWHILRPRRLPVGRRSFWATSRRNAPDSQGEQSVPALLQSYKRSVNFPAATHQIPELTGNASPMGKEVVVHGYLGESADLSKNLSFIPLFNKELDHCIQLVSSAKGRPDAPSSHAVLKSLRPHSPVALTGLLKPRTGSTSDGSEIQKITDCEIHLTGVQCLNHFPTDIIVKPDTNFSPEQRHLQLRTNQSNRDALKFRARVAAVCRDVLAQQNFTEVETPLLFKSTPEGAREFLVPTRRKGRTYALPQSPQQYKQILMASGIAKYYQLAKCFRDEDLRADRQPEFTQLDLEMSFATGEDVMRCVEGLIRTLWNELVGAVSVELPFARLSYDDAMAKYGSDKPDTRLGMEIRDIGHLLPADLISKLTSEPDPTVEVIKLHVSHDSSATRAFVNTFMDSPEARGFHENPEGAPGIFIVDPRQPLQGLQPFGFEAAERVEELLQLDEGDLVVLQARKKARHHGGSTKLGDLRLALHREAVVQGRLAAPHGFQFLWITDFPLFTPSNETDPGQGGTTGFSSTHHPFTSPKSGADVDLLAHDPTQAKADHYDLVLNGIELGGGSRRIHDAAMQNYVLRDVLKVHHKLPRIPISHVPSLTPCHQMPPERLHDFAHLIEVLRAGCPPHAGIALGFDRLVAVMLGKGSVRDVIAFPKTGRGEDPLVNSPSLVSKEALETYHLRLVE
ncbi:MAG: hypothetical protein M1838_001405 [Thelocarpon superellum]|nr:MAG: hypothetical protein M1838_001405 [Thelocarpon superellum]